MAGVERSLSIVAIGAHMDDCWLGMGGVALKAARKGHRVTMIQAVSTYGSWPVVAGREAEIKPILRKVAVDAGVGLITLGHDYMRLVHNPELVRELAEVLAELRPDLLFCHWEDDSNQDHAVLGAASRVAGIHGACFLPPVRDAFRLPSEILQFRSDAQARNFMADTYVDVTDVLYDLLELSAAFDGIYCRYEGKSPTRLTVIDHGCGDRGVALTSHTEQKFASSLLDGCQCGVRFAEGFRAYNCRALGSHLLAQL